ncbi:MAG TPA: ABC transporter permease [Spirochaetota bacterium]|nr:ABC transporter permease [Spirochaetota bacterium]OPZ35444.1 MAG: Inner membrane transport permease YbhS [Spirochaetes bacterium ADurb.BinA120]HNU92908.1 ABC transporter permease [Spirochaetota bacterium]HPV99195.1 ABC transporter permease [Spirochaetota bacterium]
MKALKSLVRIGAIAGKEWLQIRRDTRSLILSLIAPALLILLFGYALTVDVKNVGMAVYDQDRSTLSRRLLEEFSHTEYLRVKRHISGYREMDRLIDSEEIALAIVVPRGFERRFKAGKSVDLQLIVDGSDSTSATVAMGYVKAILANFNMDIKVSELKRIGIAETKMPVEVKSRVWYNPELLSKNFIVPGLIVVVLSIISALIASLTISREWERGTMETLITTPVRAFELVFGKLVPYLFIGLFDVVITVLLGYLVFNVPIKGSFVELYMLALLFLIGTTSLGIIISSATRAQVLSVQVAIMVTYLPSFMLSGFVFPIQNMPLVVQGITYLIPAKYLIVIIKGIALKGVGAALLWTQILFLAVFAFIVVIASVRKLSLTLPEN